MNKVYKYGLLAPTAGENIINQQCDLAWRSAVARARVENDYRRERRELERMNLPMVARIHDLEAQIECSRAVLRGLRTGRDKPDGLDAEALRQGIATWREEIRQLRPEAARERAAFRGTGQAATIKQARHDRLLELAQAFAGAGLFWGQRQLVELAHDQRCKIREDSLRIPTEWDAVGIQLQGGLPVEGVEEDPRLCLTPAAPVPGRSGKPCRRLRLRIGPADGVAEWPIILHRPLPADSTIRFAKVRRERIGRQLRWTAQLTLDMPDPVPVPRSEKMIAVAPRFVGSDDLGLVAATTRDYLGERTIYVLHPDIVGGLARATDLRAIRDTRRDAVLLAITAWLDQLAARPVGWPATIARWESCDRLRRFVWEWWRTHRVDGDDVVFADAEAWAYQDRHLWDYERHAERGALDRRLHDYRNWAAMLAERYDAIIVPGTDYRRMAVRRAEPERDHELSHEGSRQRVISSPGVLRTCLIAACASRGKRVLLSPHLEVETMWRERSSAVEKVRTARTAKFSARHHHPAGEEEEMRAAVVPSGEPLAEGAANDSPCGG